MPVQQSEQCRPSPREAGCSTVLLSSLRSERECIERAGGRAQMPLGQMQIDGRYFEVSMAEQYLDGAQVSAGFEKVCGEAMSQGMRMDVSMRETCAFGGCLT